MKADKGATNKKQIACAKDLLDDAARVRKVTEGAALAGYSQRKSCNIASDVTDDELRRNASHHGFMAQANYVVNIGVNLQQLKEFERAVSRLETEHGGGTMTKKFGNFSSNCKAKQRSLNTGPRGLDLTDKIVARGSGTEVACESTSVAVGGVSVGGGGTSLRKSPHPIFTSGINKIWGLVKGANARELHLNADKKDLTTEMKLSRKIAKKTSKKMRLGKDDHEYFVQCMLATDGVPLSQATLYENGDVMTKDGRTFCSQHAVKQFRNATDTDSEEDN
jgi:hypothetical protein